MRRHSRRAGALLTSVLVTGSLAAWPVAGLAQQLPPEPVPELDPDPPSPRPAAGGAPDAVPLPVLDDLLLGPLPGWEEPGSPVPAGTAWPDQGPPEPLPPED